MSSRSKSYIKQEHHLSFVKKRDADDLVITDLLEFF